VVAEHAGAVGGGHRPGAVGAGVVDHDGQGRAAEDLCRKAVEDGADPIGLVARRQYQRHRAGADRGRSPGRTSMQPHVHRRSQQRI
jgi:hypothetical protein